MPVLSWNSYGDPQKENPVRELVCMSFEIETSQIKARLLTAPAPFSVLSVTQRANSPVRLALCCQNSKMRETCTKRLTMFYSAHADCSTMITHCSCLSPSRAVLVVRYCTRPMSRNGNTTEAFINQHNSTTYQLLRLCSAHVRYG
jgi:hypothetical protein